MCAKKFMIESNFNKTENKKVYALWGQLSVEAEF